MPERDNQVVARQIFLRSMVAGNRGAPAKRLASLMTDVHYPPDATIYRRGEASDQIFFIVRGTVHLELEGTKPWIMNDRSVVGVIDANLERPRSRTAVAKTAVHTLMLRMEDYLEMLEDNFEQSLYVLRMTNEGLRELIKKVEPENAFRQLIPTEDRGGWVPLNPIERILALRGAAAFQDAGIQGTTQLAQIAEEILVPPGPFALPAKSRGGLVLVARGLVEMRNATRAMQFGAKTLIGGFSSLEQRDPGVRLTAVVPSVLLILGSEDLYDVMEDHFDLTRSILRHNIRERERLLELQEQLFPEETSAPISPAFPPAR